MKTSLSTVRNARPVFRSSTQRPGSRLVAALAVLVVFGLVLTAIWTPRGRAQNKPDSYESAFDRKADKTLQGHCRLPIADSKHMRSQLTRSHDNL